MFHVIEVASVQIPMIRHASEVGWASLPHSRKEEESR